MAEAAMSVEEAARHLGVTHRSVRSYIAQGLLSTTKSPNSRRKWLQPLEVEELRKDRLRQTVRTPLERRGEVLELKAALRRLRSEMDVVLRVLDMHEVPLRLDVPTARSIHEAATADLLKTGWTVDALAQWAELFVQLNEEDLAVVAAAVPGARPWSVFLRLCIALIVYTHEHPSYKTDLDLQMMHRRLTEGRRRLRVAALCYDDLYNADPDRELKRASLLDSPASIRESLLSRVRRKKER
jgi:DNA-binding transcriptional MerR regulator